MSERLIVKTDSTVLNTMDLCPERWNLEFYQNWRPQKQAKALERGILMHDMLKHFYKQRKKGRNRPADMPSLVEECLMIGRISASNSTHIDAEEYQEDMRVFKEYFQRWQYDGWEILKVEQPFSKPLYESEKLLILYEGIIDIEVMDPKLGRLIVDHKTEGRHSDPFELSNQFQGYQWAMDCPLIVNKLGYQQAPKMEDEIVEGKKVRVDNRFRRILMNSSPEALKEWREDAIRLVIDSIGWVKDINAGKRVRKNRTSCDKWSGCIYQQVCKEPPEVREHKLLVKFFKDKPWDVFTRDANRREPELESVASD